MTKTREYLSVCPDCTQSTMGNTSTCPSCGTDMTNIKIVIKRIKTTIAKLDRASKEVFQLNIIKKIIIALKNDIKNGYYRRQYIIIKAKIAIAEAQIRTRAEVLDMKPCRQRGYELARIQKAEADLPGLRDILAGLRRDNRIE